MSTSLDTKKKEIQQILDRTSHELLAIILSDPVPEPVKTRRDGMMGIAEACEYLDCSETQLRHMVKTGLLPERRIGVRLRFKAEELDRATEVKGRLKEAV